jgi:hypothetical protein
LDRPFILGVLPFFLLLSACGGAGNGDSNGGDSDSDADGDADSDADSDSDTDSDGDADSTHPEGWSDPGRHGLAAKLQDPDCTVCHGADLSGGSAGVSCDGCHESGWRTSCTFCHGGTDDSSGAPPVDIDGSASDLSFPEHTLHVQEVDHPAWGCVQCHVNPIDVLTGGHLFTGDDSPGVAEVTFAGGLSSSGTYGGSGSCGNLYCHGNGADVLGSANSGHTLGCGACHGSAGSPGSLSGQHATHLEAGFSCQSCHVDTAKGGSTIADPKKHVDGEVEVGFTSDVSWNGSTCTGHCHTEDHSAYGWSGGDDD